MIIDVCFLNINFKTDSSVDFAITAI